MARQALRSYTFHMWLKDRPQKAFGQMVPPLLMHRMGAAHFLNKRDASSQVGLTKGPSKKKCR